MQFSLRDYKNGFTLVETLVAISILLITIVGPMTIAQKGIQNAYFATEQVTAVFLAQEAIEAVRELRDNAALDAYDRSTDGGGSPGDTEDWLPAACTGATACAYDSISGAFESCASNNGCVLRFNTSLGKYTYETLGATVFESPFTRTVVIGNTIVGGRQIIVTISWNARIFGGTTRSVVLQSWLYDHYQRFE